MCLNKLPLSFYAPRYKLFSNADFVKGFLGFGSGTRGLSRDFSEAIGVVCHFEF